MRRPDVRELRRILLQAAVWAGQACNSLGAEEAQGREALALLEEARGWLGPSGPEKPPKLRREPYPWPEHLLFRAISALRVVQFRLARELRARASSAEHARAQALIRAASERLKSAWLSYLRAQGLPAGCRPVQTLSFGGGLFLSALSGGLSSLAGGYFLKPGESWPMTLAYVGWLVFCAFLLRRFAYPRRGREKPLILPRTQAARHPLPLALFLTGLPALGLLLRPGLWRVLGLFSLGAFAMGLPIVIQALRLLVYPAEARVLVLPGRCVVFSPRVLSVSEEKVFVDFPL